MSLDSPIVTDRSDVLWKLNLKEQERAYPSIMDDCETALVVIGAGFAGLNAAIHARKAGMDVIVLEAGVLGGGGSSRNGGYCVPQFATSIGPMDVIRSIGRQKAEALCDMIGHGPTKVFEQIKAFGIECSAVQKGWAQPAHSSKSLKRAKQLYEEWKALGHDVEWHSGDEINGLLGTQDYIGGWSNKTGGTVNPYSLSLGLGRVADELGVKIFEHSAVTGITEEGSDVICTVGQYTVRAKKALIATNGYTGAFARDVQRSSIPVKLYHGATKPLRPELREEILASGYCFGDLRKSGGFGRLDEQGRLTTGGVVFAGVANRQGYGERHMRHRMKEMYPQMTDMDLQFDGYWEGYCAVTDNWLPHVHHLGRSVFSVSGFGTRGVNMAQNLGMILGEFLADKRTLSDIPVEVIDGRRDVPFWSVQTFGAGFSFPYYQGLDKLRMS
jgi:glycine/D-amino acid oxidase-like deaminating enzyme